MANESQTIGELRCIGGRVFSAGILVPFIDLKISVAERLQMFSLPVGVGQSLAFVDGAIVGGSTPPTDRSGAGDARVVEETNCVPVGQ